MVHTLRASCLLAYGPTLGVEGTEGQGKDPWARNEKDSSPPALEDRSLWIEALPTSYMGRLAENMKESRAFLALAGCLMFAADPGVMYQLRKPGAPHMANG